MKELAQKVKQALAEVGSELEDNDPIIKSILTASDFDEAYDAVNRIAHEAAIAMGVINGYLRKQVQVF